MMWIALLSSLAFATPPGELAGRWVFSGSSAETAKVSQVVEEAAGRFNFMIRSIARGKIATACAIDSAIVITGDDNTIQMDFEGPDARSRKGPSDGSAVPIPGREGTLTHKITDSNNLLVVAKTPDGDRTTVYKRNGDVLTVSHTLLSEKIGKPALQWSLTYKRQ